MEVDSVQPTRMSKLATPANGVACVIVALVAIFINDSLRPYTSSADSVATSELGPGAYVVHGGKPFPIAEATHMSLEPGDHFVFVSVDPEDAYRSYSLTYNWPAELISGGTFRRPRYLRPDSFPCEVTYRGMSEIVITPQPNLMPGFYMLNGIYPVVFSVNEIPKTWEALVKDFKMLQEDDAARELSVSIAALKKHLDELPKESRPTMLACLFDAM